MKIQKGIRVFACLIVLASCLAVAARAQSANKGESIASVAGERSEVRWRPQVEYGRLILTVSTPGGDVIRQEFEAGTDPSFKLFDNKGFNLADGQYTYELRVIQAISPEVKKALAASRENGNSEEVIRELQKSGQLPTKITVQSGSFRIEKGVVFTGSPEEGIEPKSTNPEGGISLQNKKKGGGTVVLQDVVTADDEIIQGSLCVGLDCVVNESFGFDTIRLKENNTRIKFDDTSTAAGFPNNDWQLTANDSASGGANKFSIEDITGAKVPFTITAGAPTNSVFVASTGKLGLRTSTPGLDVHANTTDTPAIRLEQNSSGGFTAQTWDIGANEANFFVRDLTGGSRLPFRVRPGAPTSSIDISASGNVGVNTASPSSKLTIDAGNAAANTFSIQNMTSGGTFSINDSIIETSRTDGLFLMFTNNAKDINFQNGKVVFKGNTGNVGIGTATPAGKIDVNGSIFQRGVQLFADYVFEPSYTVESIEDHAAFMWNNKHLPAVGAKQVDEQGREFVEIGARMRGMLEEIEKAHIYISTLSDSIAQKDAELSKLAKQNAELAERLARIEAMLSASKSEKK